MPEWTEKDFESYTQSDWELIKTVKQLADENLDNVKILTRANDIALAIFGMLCVRLRDNGEEGADGLGMSLQEYTGTVLANAKRKKEDDGWAAELAILRGVARFVQTYHCPAAATKRGFCHEHGYIS